MYATCAFQVAAPAVLELRGSESELVSLFAGSLRGTAWGSRIFFHRLNTHWFLQPEVVRAYLPALEPWAWCVAWTPCSDISLLNFYPPHIDVGQAHSNLCSS